MKRIILVVVVGLLTSLVHAADEPMYLFVQSAKSVKISQDKITLKGVSASTVYFSDRPERIAGHVTTKKFVDDWAVGEDSFKLNNPNAAVSVFGSGDEVENLVVILSNPVLKWGSLSYDIKIIDGKIPKKGGECSLFIDIIGRPRSPMSIGGIARRTTRRHVIVGSSVARNQAAEAQSEADEARDDADAAEARADAATASASATPTKTTQRSPEEKMEQLNKIYKDGYITEEEYNKKKQAILSTF